MDQRRTRSRYRLSSLLVRAGRCIHHLIPLFDGHYFSLLAAKLMGPSGPSVVGTVWGGAALRRLSHGSRLLPHRKPDNHLVKRGSTCACLLSGVNEA